MLQCSTCYAGDARSETHHSLVCSFHRAVTTSDVARPTIHIVQFQFLRIPALVLVLLLLLPPPPGLELDVLNETHGRLSAQAARLEELSSLTLEHLCVPRGWKYR